MKYLKIILPILALITIMSCSKDDQDDIQQMINEDIIPEALVDSLTACGFILHDGAEPMNITGEYLSNSTETNCTNISGIFADLLTLDANWTIDQFNANDQTIRIALNLVGVEIKSTKAFITGTDNDFTVYGSAIFRNVAIDPDDAARIAFVLSGTKTDAGLANLETGFTLIEIIRDENVGFIPEGSYAALFEEDLLAE